MNALAKGTRYMLGKEAEMFRSVTGDVMSCLAAQGHQEFDRLLLAMQD